MMRILLHWLFIVLGLWFSAMVLPGINFSSYTALLVAGAVLGLMNVVFKPLIKLLTFPLIVVTLGLFLTLINAFLLYLAGHTVSGFEARGFWSLMLGGIFTSAITSVFVALTRRQKD